VVKLKKVVHTVPMKGIRNMFQILVKNSGGRLFSGNNLMDGMLKERHDIPQ
jgi:hypothetical protein